MTFKQIYEKEKNNHSEIILYKEGIFLKAYERSAFLLNLNGANLKEKWKPTKEIPDGIVTTGFPDSSRKKFTTDLNLDTINENDTEIILVARTVPEDIELSFQKWKNDIISKNEDKHPAKNKKKQNDEKETSWMKDILKRIANHDTLNTDIIQSITFFSGIQKEIRQKLENITA